MNNRAALLTGDVRVDRRRRQDGRRVSSVHRQQQQNHEAPHENDQPRREGDSAHRFPGARNLRNGCTDKSGSDGRRQILKFVSQVLEWIGTNERNG